MAFKNIHVRLTEQQAAALERVQKSLGVSSTSETIRLLIHTMDTKPTPPTRPKRSRTVGPLPLWARNIQRVADETGVPVERLAEDIVKDMSAPDAGENIAEMPVTESTRREPGEGWETRLRNQIMRLSA
jgi:hypothetical protein